MRGTVDVVRALQDAGYRLNVGYVRWLLMERHVPMPASKVGGNLLWDESDVDRLKSVLRRRGRAPETMGQAVCS